MGGLHKQGRKRHFLANGLLVAVDDGINFITSLGGGCLGACPGEFHFRHCFGLSYFKTWAKLKPYFKTSPLFIHHLHIICCGKVRKLGHFSYQDFHTSPDVKLLYTAYYCTLEWLILNKQKLKVTNDHKKFSSRFWLVLQSTNVLYKLVCACQIPHLSSPMFQSNIEF